MYNKMKSCEELLVVYKYIIVRFVNRMFENHNVKKTTKYNNIYETIVNIKLQRITLLRNVFVLQIRVKLIRLLNMNCSRFTKF